ncbi:hypothetical protein BC834DRAFT_426026 [Gloeopeniophorella convolvens]|nr:hypothetical protein BC834DRAFT_426026 [Gloeopeniophorella convolvens]
MCYSWNRRTRGRCYQQGWILESQGTMLPSMRRALRVLIAREWAVWSVSEGVRPMWRVTKRRRRTCAAANSCSHMVLSSPLRSLVRRYWQSMLMCAIANGQVEAFPSLMRSARSCGARHRWFQGDTSVLTFILTDKRILADEQEVIEALASVGFNDERQRSAIGSLSGAWKMKLALARVMFFKRPTSSCSMSRPTIWTLSILLGSRDTSRALVRTTCPSSSRTTRASSTTRSPMSST